MLSQPNIAILNSSNAMLTTAGTIPLNTANSNNVYPTTSSLDNWNEELISAQTNPLFSNDNTTVTTSQYLFNTTEPDSNSTMPTSNPADLEVSAESSMTLSTC